MAIGPAILGASAVITASTAPEVGKINRYNASVNSLAPVLPALSGLAVGATLIVQKDDLDATENTVVLAAPTPDTFDNGRSNTILRYAGSSRKLQVVSVGGTKYWKVVEYSDPGIAPVKMDKSLMLRNAFRGIAGFAYGNSWTASTNYSAAPYASRIPAVTGLTSMTNRGINGRRAQDIAIAAISGVGDVSKRWTAGTKGIVTIDGLLNNLMEGDNAKNRASALEAVRAFCALVSASSRAEVSDVGTFSTSPAWVSATSAQAWSSGGTLGLAAVEGAYVDIPCPAGTAYLLAWGCNGTDFIGGSLSISQAGGFTTVVKDMNDLGQNTPYETNSGVTPVAIKLTGLQAGTVRVTSSKAGRSGTVYNFVDALLPQSATPPMIAVVKPVEVRATSHYPQAALLTYLQTIPDLMAAEFPNVVPIDPTPGWSPTEFLGADKLHPTEVGQRHELDAWLVGINAEMSRRAMLASFGSGLA